MRLDGVLFFPVTPFDDGGVDTAMLERHVDSRLSFGPGAVFVACGTGEMHALGPDEHAAAVKVAVATCAGATPVLAGAGGPLPTAVEHARRAEEAGADGILLLPPYLVGGPVEGVVGYVRAVAASTRLPVVVYQRGQVRFTPSAVAELASLDNVVGFKDGLGDLELMHRIVLEVRRTAGEDFLFFNGLPTAEVTVPAYRGVGVPLYSSAVFCFAPEVAEAYHRATEDGDRETVERLTALFYAPLVALRDRAPGYAVSLVKAGVRLRGLDVGRVRPPLVEPTERDLRELDALIATGLSLVGA
jgi:5-dehydro-4-deoxyglucarate dehydratase